jgi:hypothetical protein
MFQGQRQPKAPSGDGHGLVEGRIETCHLWQARTKPGNGINGREIVGLVQGRQRLQDPECLPHFFSQQARRSKIVTAMNHPVPHSYQRPAIKMVTGKRKDFLKEPLIPSGFGPPFGYGNAVGFPGIEARLRTQIFNAASKEATLAALKQRKFDT